MTTDPHHHECHHEEPAAVATGLSRRSLLKRSALVAGGVAAGVGGGVSLAAPASALTGHNEIAGQKLHYYNGSVDNNRAATTFRFNEPTYLHAERALNHYLANTPSAWTAPLHLWLNGVYVDKPGRHGEGRAIDVAYVYATSGGRLIQTFNADYLWWKNQSAMATYRKRYWAYVASLNRFFNPVLHYWYTPDRFSGAGDRSHERHVHYDDGTSGVGTQAVFTASSGRNVQNYMVQSALVYIWGISVAIDGYYGPATEAATRTALRRIGITDGTLRNSSYYGSFLAETCRAGSGLYTPTLATFEAAEAAEPKAQVSG